MKWELNIYIYISKYICVCIYIYIYIYIYIHNLDCALAQGCHFGANGDWLAVVCQYLLHILWFQNSIKYPRLLAWVYMLKNTHWLILWPQTTPPPTSYQYRKSFWEFISPQIYAIMCGDHKTVYFHGFTKADCRFAPVRFEFKYNDFQSRKSIHKCRLEKWRPFCHGINLLKLLCITWVPSNIIRTRWG